MVFFSKERSFTVSGSHDMHGTEKHTFGNETPRSCIPLPTHCGSRVVNRRGHDQRHIYICCLAASIKSLMCFEHRLLELQIAVKRRAAQNKLRIRKGEDMRNDLASRAQVILQPGGFKSDKLQ